VKAEGEKGKGKLRKGTQIRFKPDAQIFTQKTEFDPKIIRSRMKELAFLNSTSTFRQGLTLAPISAHLELTVPLSAPLKLTLSPI
jgi:DNA gyrase/topoisomerase IV subunit B